MKSKPKLTRRSRTPKPRLIPAPMKSESTFMRIISFKEAIREAQDQCLETIPECFIIGEGVGDPKNIFGTTTVGQRSFIAKDLTGIVSVTKDFLDALVTTPQTQNG